MKKRKKHSPEQIVAKLRDAHVMLNSGKSRQAVFAAPIPRMKRLKSHAKLQDRFLRVQGKLHA